MTWPVDGLTTLNVKNFRSRSRCDWATCVCVCVLDWAATPSDTHTRKRVVVPHTRQKFCVCVLGNFDCQAILTLPITSLGSYTFWRVWDYHSFACVCVTAQLQLFASYNFLRVCGTTTLLRVCVSLLSYNFLQATTFCVCVCVLSLILWRQRILACRVENIEF